MNVRTIANIKEEIRSRERIVEDAEAEIKHQQIRLHNNKQWLVELQIELKLAQKSKEAQE